MRGKAVMLTALVLLAGCVKESAVAPPAPSPSPLTAKEQKLAEAFIRHRSPHPVELARVVARMKRPRLAAAQAIIESNANKHAVGSSGERGVWQIIEKEWGAVSDDLKGQSDQYEEIMEGLIKGSQGNLRRALGKYNGDRSGRYAQKVMAQVARL